MPKIFKNIKHQLFKFTLRFKRKSRFINWKKIDWNKFKFPGLISLGLLIIIGLFLWVRQLPPRAPEFKKSIIGDYSFEAKNKVFQAKFGIKEQQPIITFNVNKNKSITLSYQNNKSSQPTLDAVAGDLTFKNVEPNMDIKYQTLANGIKEEITLNQARQKEEDTNVFIFEGNFQDAYPKEIIKGISGTAFYDSKDNYLFHFEKPFAIDAAGNRTDSIIMQIENKNDSKIKKIKDSANDGTAYLIRLTIDKAWLNDPARTYPIIIDPTIVHDTTAEFATGTFNESKDTGSGATPSIENYYQALTVDKNTVGLWHLDEASGNVLDSSGNGSTGTPAGTAVVAGLLGNARSFNGSSDYLDMGAPSNLMNITNAITIEAWVKRGVTATMGHIAGTYGVADLGYNLTFGVGDANNDKICFTIQGIANYCTSGTYPDVTKWHHVAATYDRSRINLYFDGVLTDSFNQTVALGVANGSFRIGKRAGAGTYAFNGSIDEVRISNIARSSEEIKAAASRRPSSIYTSPILNFGNTVKVWNNFSWTELGVSTGDGEILKDSTGLAAQWNFNENSGITLTSTGACGSTCSGTLTGFPSIFWQDQETATGWTSVNRRWGAGALMFDGVDDEVSTSTNIGISGTQPRTISTWTKLNNFSATNYIQPIVSWGSCSTGLANVLGTRNNGFFFWGHSADLQGSPQSLGVWHYVVFTYDGTNGKLYVDGKLDKSGNITLNTNNTPVKLGGNYSSCSSSTNYFKGIIDSTQIYSRTLTASEILSNYQAGNIDLLTRVGDTTNPDDGTWEAWKPTTTVETIVESFDNYTLSGCTGGTVLEGGRVHMFKTSGSLSCANNVNVDVLVVAGGGGGGTNMGGGGGGGGVIYKSSVPITASTSYTVTIGAGGNGAPAGTTYAAHPAVAGTNGGNSVFGSLTAIGGGRGGSSYNSMGLGINAGAAGGSGGGATGYNDNGAAIGAITGGAGTAGQGFRGGNQGNAYYSGGGGGAGGSGGDGNSKANGGIGFYSDILGPGYFWGGGGGGAGYSVVGGNGGNGGGGGGAAGVTYGGSGLNSGSPGGGGCTGCWTSKPGGDGGANTGGGGGGAGHYFSNNKGGAGGSGIVIVRISTLSKDTNLKTEGTSSQKINTTKDSDNNTVALWHFDETGGTENLQIPDGSTALMAAKSCRSLKLNLFNKNGMYWIDPDGANVGNYPTQAYCDMTNHGGGWTLALNLNTNDGAIRHYYDTDFWTAPSVYGNANIPFSTDYKSAAFSQFPADELMMFANNNGFQMGTATYSLIAPASGKTLYWMFNSLANTTITGARTANTGSVGANGRGRNAGDAFIDNAQAMIINSTYQPLDAANETRLGTNYASVCAIINCNGHTYGGWGGRHSRAGWGAYYEGAALNGYCPPQGAFGTNGSLYSTNNAFNGTTCGTNTSLYHDVDMGVFIRNSADVADPARIINDYVKSTTSLPFANGGTVSNYGTNTIHAFYESDNFIVNGTQNVEALVVAGGGGGGDDMGGGGGGGGVISNASYAVSPNIYPIVIGAGGAGSPGTYAAAPVAGSNGGNSVFDTLSAIGGGGGGSGHRTDAPYVGGRAEIGGSGGGAAASYMYSGAPQTMGAVGTAGQGTKGGNSPTVNADYYGGGGGGAGGNAEVNAVNSTRAGRGGPGLASSILGPTYYFGAGGGGAGHSGGPAGWGGQGGGGGGSTWTAPSTAGAAGTGGIGIAQSGSVTAAGAVGGAAGPHTGSGGGGGNHQGPGGAGGSGVVIVSYPTSYSPVTVNITGNPVGTTVTNGISGKARSFNGTTDYIEIENNANLNLTANFTYETWVYPTSYSGCGGALGFNCIIANKEFSYEWAIDGNGQLGWAITNTSPGWTFVATGLIAPLNQWTHIAIAYNGITMDTYKNGVLVQSYAATGKIGVNSNALRIGARNAPGVATAYFAGKMDEVRISNVTRSTEDIAENYRMSRDKNLNKTITSVDLSGKKTLPFYVAADKPGSYLTAMLGESDYVNYQSDANTVGFWHLDEETGSGAYLRDSSVNSSNGTPSGPTFTQGKIGKARSFNAGSAATQTDYVNTSMTNTGSTKFSTAFTVEAWIFPTAYDAAHNTVVGQENGFLLAFTPTGAVADHVYAGGAWSSATGGSCTVPLNTWSYKTMTYDGTTLRSYLNGTLCNTSAKTGSMASASLIYIGMRDNGGTKQPFHGTIDEARISNAVRSDENIRQAYEVGLRSHPITIDFGAKLYKYQAVVGDAKATGGTISTTDKYVVHTFTSNGTFTPNTNITNADVLMVGGGGAGGGRHGGGGGGGGVLYMTSVAANSGTGYPMVIGPGAPTNTGRTNSKGANGSNTTAFGETAIGGGGGGAYCNGGGIAGGSGGGTGHSGCVSNDGGAATQGNPISHTGFGYGSAGANNITGGNEASGGGGAGGIGQQSVAESYGGAGGAGIPININGSGLFWGGGGGGGGWTNNGGNGGIGGGGGGANAYANVGQTAGTGGGSAINPGANGVIIFNPTTSGNPAGGAGGANTGGGGGGSGQADWNTMMGDGGAGGSGIVIVRYPITNGVDLIDSASDLTFNIDATIYGLSQKGSGIFPGEKIIVKENFNGTEYLAQGVVGSINASTGAITVLSWDVNSTFPAAGFTTDASIFKWQREYWNIAEPLDSQFNAVTNFILRITDGNEGRTVWIDDLNSAGDYLSNPVGNAITSSVGKNYFQYRAILTSFDEAVSPALSAVTLDYLDSYPPTVPTLDAPIDNSVNQNRITVLKTTSTDADSDYLRYKIELCTNIEMTANCQTFDQTISQFGWSGQDAEVGSAYASNTQATFTLQAELQLGTVYYWRSYAIDPAGTDTWSQTQTEPYNFTTVEISPASSCTFQTNIAHTSLSLTWTDNANNEDYYEVQRSVDGGAWAVFQTALPADSASLIDSSITNGHTYKYRIAPYIASGPFYAQWCTTSVSSVGIGRFSLEGIGVTGLRFD
jgi:hypothetical protein